VTYRSKTSVLAQARLRGETKAFCLPFLEEAGNYQHWTGVYGTSTESGKTARSDSLEGKARRETKRKSRFDLISWKLFAANIFF
jgi:hypothetical protein